MEDLLVAEICLVMLENRSGNHFDYELSFCLCDGGLMEYFWLLLGAINKNIFLNLEEFFYKIVGQRL